MTPNICAVIVTFHPKAELLENLRYLRPQLPGLIVVDNGSDAVSLELLRNARKQFGFELLENGANLGIGQALNRGVRAAIEQGFSWVVLFDQDSSARAGFIDSLYMGYAENPQRDGVAIFCPRYVDRTTGKSVVTSAMSPDCGPVVAMTSGSLMPIWVFQECGWFLEELFIDQVDVEYCFRVRSMGYHIALSSKANLMHGAGDPKTVTFFGRKLFRTTRHSPKRRYYMTRNRIWVARQYSKKNRDWSSAIFDLVARDTIKVLLVEEDRFSKLRYILLGVWDGFRGNLGKRVEL